MIIHRGGKQILCLSERLFQHLRKVGRIDLPMLLIPGDSFPFVPFPLVYGIKMFFNMLWQHRTIASASLSRLFAPLPQFRKWEIHTVFLHFRNFELEQKSCLRLLAELCGAALVQIQCHFEHIHVADTFCLFIVYSSNLVFILCMRKAFPMHKIISLQNVVCISAWKV